MRRYGRYKSPVDAASLGTASALLCFLFLRRPFRSARFGEVFCTVRGLAVAADDALTRAEPAEKDAPGRDLLAWLAEEGALVCSGVDVIRVAPFGRELVAADFIESGEVLLRLPPDLCIPAPANSEKPQDHAKQLSEDVRLAAFLLSEARNPAWAAYRAVWPSLEDLQERLPVFWEPTQLHEYTDVLPHLEGQVASRRRLLQKASQQFQVPLDELTWAHALVSTRAVGAGTNACAMIPGVDLANHSPEPNAELVVAGEPGVQTFKATVTKHGEVWEHGTAGLVALRDVAPGEALRISYGSYPNQRFLLDYGFSLGSANPKGDDEEPGEMED